jgi:hypothetical protein
MKRLLAIALLSLGVAASAQTTATKKELVAKILQLQAAGIEGAARQLAERPALLLMQGANTVMQTRVPPDKREPIVKEIQGDVKKYMDDVMPLLRASASKNAPATVGSVLEEKFTEDELKQLIAIIESPVNRKYLQLGVEMQKSLLDKIVADTRGVMDPKIKALELSMSNRLGLPPPAPAADASAAKAPARAASK